MSIAKAFSPLAEPVDLLSLKKPPLSVKTKAVFLERATGIEPASSAWEADVLPMNYARKAPGKAPEALVSEHPRIWPFPFWWTI